MATSSKPPLRWLAALVLAGVASAQAAPQVDRLLEAAQNGSPVVRPQAAERLIALADEAAPRMLTLLETESLADLGQELVEVAGKLGSAELRERLWRALDDRDFPWRPAAARGLAASIQAFERERALAWLDDPLASVRSAGVTALGALDARADEPVLHALLKSDSSDRVRRDAAELVDAWGTRWALAWIVEELDRTDVFFDQDTGRAARFAATRALEQRLGHALAVRPEEPASAPANAAAFQALRDEVKALAGGRWPKLPAVAKVGAAVPPALLGLEIRSCRAGEHFLRFSADDRLWLGVGANPTSVALEPGTVERLVATIGAALEPLEVDTWGEPGCDAEQLYLRTDPAAAPRIWRVSKGAEAVADLRPEALAAALRALVAAVPEAIDGAPARRTLDAALSAVGGPLE
ncbi:MAG: hypothetical protein WD226_09255 [Planctomycetota bacterium]